jgi:predicted metalloprotease with PDZ domain
VRHRVDLLSASPRRASLVRLIAILLAFGLAPAGAQTSFAYRLDLRPSVRDRGRVRVAVTAKGVPEGPVSFCIPAWKPGAYRLENWQRRVANLTATGPSGAALTVDYKPDRTWVVSGDHQGQVHVEYDMLASDYRASWVCCEGPETFLYVRNPNTGTAVAAPCTLAVDAPIGWKVVCALHQDAAPEWTTTFTAPDYDTLADCPVEAGELVIDSWKMPDETKASGFVAYTLVYNMEPRFDGKAMRDMCRKIVECATKLMRVVPYDRYYFMWHLHDQQAFTGGLEHLYCTTLYLPQFALARSVEDHASLVAHEFFHLWNVKRIRPLQLGPFDYSAKVPVSSLWLMEGVTDYYAEVICVRSGIWSENRVLREIKSQLQSLHDDVGYHVESVEESSRAAFDRKWMEGGIDYYNMGKIIGLLLDIEIRTSTKNAKSLDDVMRLLYERFAPPKLGFKDADVRVAVSEIAGRDMREWLQLYVEGKRDLPFAESFARAGLLFSRTETRVRESSQDMAHRNPEVIVENKGDDLAPSWSVLATAENTTGDETLPLKVGDVIEAIGGKTPRAATNTRTFIGRNLALAMRGLPSDVASVLMTVKRGTDTIEVPLRVPMRSRYKVDLRPNPDETDPLRGAIRDVILGREKPQ